MNYENDARRKYLAYGRIHKKCHRSASQILQAAAELAQHGQDHCIATSGKLFIGGKLSVAVINEYAISLKGNKTFVKLDNGTQVSMVSEAALCAIKNQQQSGQGMSR